LDYIVCHNGIIYTHKFKKSYVGQTSNLDKRLLEHNHTAEKGFTVSYRPWTLVHTEVLASRSEAMKREKYLKTWAGRIEVNKCIYPNYSQKTRIKHK
jgi:putative endonuclease